MIIRAYPSTQVMVRCPGCGEIFDLMFTTEKISYNKHGQVTHGYTRCESCPEEFEFDIEYKE